MARSIWLLILPLWIPVGVGCGKKSSGGGGGGATDSKEYALKASFPRVGGTVRHTHQSKMELSGEIRGLDGQLQKQLNERKVEDIRWKETTLAADARGEDDWSRLRVVFERYEIEGADAPGKRPDLTGRSFLIERMGGGITFKDESGKPIERDAEAQLRKRYRPSGPSDAEPDFVAHRDLLPAKPVRIGESYDLPADKMARSFGDVMPLDADKATATGKLTRVYEKNGHQFGVIEVNIALPVMSTPQFTVAGESKMTVTIHYDGCIDGSVCEARMTGGVEGKVDGKGPRGVVKLSVSAKLDISESE